MKTNDAPFESKLLLLKGRLSKGPKIIPNLRILCLKAAGALEIPRRTLSRLRSRFTGVEERLDQSHVKIFAAGDTRLNCLHVCTVY